jgi:hypothetical protein
VPAIVAGPAAGAAEHENVIRNPQSLLLNNRMGCAIGRDFLSDGQAGSGERNILPTGTPLDTETRKTIHPQNSKNDDGCEDQSMQNNDQIVSFDFQRRGLDKMSAIGLGAARALRRPEIHKFSLGETVVFTPGSDAVIRNPTRCKVTRLLPKVGTEFQYHIQFGPDGQQRMVQESRLRPIG